MRAGPAKAVGRRGGQAALDHVADGQLLLAAFPGDVRAADQQVDQQAEHRHQQDQQQPCHGRRGTALFRHQPENDHVDQDDAGPDQQRGDHRGDWFRVCSASMSLDFLSADCKPPGLSLGNRPRRPIGLWRSGRGDFSLLMAESDVGGTSRVWDGRPARLAELESSGVSHPRSGSTSTNRALTKRLAGTARNAPTPPKIVLQTIRERKLSVADSPTVVPTTRGWMTLWRMMLRTQ